MKNNNKKITIGIFNDSFFPMIDGVVSVVHNYAKYLSKYANVIVFAPTTPGADYDDSTLPYKVVRCSSFKMHIIDYSCPIPMFDRKFKKELKKYNLDIVHIHSPFSLGSVGIKYAKKHNIPVIATMHSQFKQDFQRAVKFKWFANLLTKIIIKTFNKCDECWAVNQEVARIFYEDYGYKQMPKVMNNATEMEPVKDYQKARDIINKKYNIKDTDKVFLFVGRLTILKNIFFLVNTLKVLKDKNPDFNFRMLFVGSGQDENELKKLIKTKKMEKEITLCGKVSDRELLATFFARADLFLFPSLYDASSIVQIEAASQKTPTVFLEGSATSATVTNNRNGYIVNNSEEDYADKILEIMKNEKKYKEVCENTFKEIYVHWETKMEQIYKIYLDIIKKKQS